MHCTLVTLMYLNEGAGDPMYVWSRIFLNAKKKPKTPFLSDDVFKDSYVQMFFFNIKRKDDVLEKLTYGSETDTRVKSKI